MDNRENNHSKKIMYGIFGIQYILLILFHLFLTIGIWNYILVLDAYENSDYIDLNKNVMNISEINFIIISCCLLIFFQCIYICYIYTNHFAPITLTINMYCLIYLVIVILTMDLKKCDQRMLSCITETKIYYQEINTTYNLTNNSNISNYTKNNNVTNVINTTYVKKTKRTPEDGIFNLQYATLINSTKIIQNICMGIVFFQIIYASIVCYKMHNKKYYFSPIKWKELLALVCFYNMFAIICIILPILCIIYCCLGDDCCCCIKQTLIDNVIHGRPQPRFIEQYEI